MSFLTVAPDMVTAAAGNLESVGSALNEAAAAAAPATVGLAAPGRGSGVGGRRGDVGGICPGFSRHQCSDRGFS